MPRHSFEFDAIGTVWKVEVTSEENPKVVEKAVRECIAEFDAVYSRFRDDSLVTKISQNIGTYTFPDNAGALFSFYRELYDVTSGHVTPLIGNLMSDAGYDSSYSLKPAKTLSPAPAWNDVMSYQDGALTVKQPVLLDFGAAGKGYLVDLVGKVLDTHKATAYLINAGGDMLRKRTDESSLPIGLEHPTDPSLAIGVVSFGTGALCGSAINRRKWADLHHVMDPISAQPTTDTLATWVTADTAMMADGLATALFFTDAALLQKHFTFEYCRVTSDLKIERSKGFQAELFS